MVTCKHPECSRDDGDDPGTPRCIGCKRWFCYGHRVISFYCDDCRKIDPFDYENFIKPLRKIYKKQGNTNDGEESKELVLKQLAECFRKNGGECLRFHSHNTDEFSIKNLHIYDNSLKCTPECEDWCDDCDAAQTHNLTFTLSDISPYAVECWEKMQSACEIFTWYQ